jgi:hypothetical protein
MTGETPVPFDLDNTDDLTQAQIDALNAEFARLWPAWRVRAPKRVDDSEITRNLCHFLMRHYLGA